MSDEPLILDDVKQRLEARNADLSGSTFTDVNLAGAAFEDVNLTGATIHNANLSGMRLTDCRIDGLTIEGIALTDLLNAWRKATE